MLKKYTYFNLALTLGMFTVLVFRAWIELKNYKIMWRELEWRQTYQAVGRILKAERDMFCRVEGDEELYRLLCEIFKVKENEKRKHLMESATHPSTRPSRNSAVFPSRNAQEAL